MKDVYNPYKNEKHMTTLHDFFYWTRKELIPVFKYED